LIGNKCDLEAKKVIDTNMGQELAKEFNMSFYETSARTGFNVHETFLAIAKSIKDKLAK